MLESPAGWSTFFPINELQRSDADISLIFLSANDIMFADKVDDLCC